MNTKAGVYDAVRASVDVFGAAGDPVVEGALVGADGVGGHFLEGGHDPAMGGRAGLVVGLGEVLDPFLIAERFHLAEVAVLVGVCRRPGYVRRSC